MSKTLECGIETHKGFVNAWECDENDHLNVQFYWKRFSEAAKIFHIWEGAPHGNWQDRHVRYHRELRMGTNTIVRTARINDNNCLLHLLIDTSDGSLSATAIDTHSPTNSSEQESGENLPIPEIARPRSLSTGPLTSESVDLLIQSGQGLITNRSIVTPAECDLDGFLQDQFHISRFSDAASHLWASKGLSRKWLHNKNFGGAAVEMKATRCKPVRAGMALEVTSWVFACTEKTLSFRHQVSDLTSKEVVYNGAATALILDLNTRRAVSLPPDIAKDLTSHQPAH